MLEQQRKVRLVMPDFEHPEPEAEEIGSSPEHRLWIAVIIAAVTEYEEQLMRVRAMWHNSQCQVNRRMLHDLESLRRECRTHWFENICDMADISVDAVLKQFDRLNRQYELQSIPFTDLPIHTENKERIQKKRYFHG